MKTFQVALVACVLPIFAWGNVPKGSPVCSGASCNDIDLPLGVEPKKEPTSLPPSTASKEEPAPPPSPIKVRRVARPSRLKERAPANSSGPTNLPAYYLARDRSGISPQDGVVLVPKSTSPRFDGLSVGDMVPAVIAQSIKASPSVPTPVRALIQKGVMKGGFLLGEATLDKELKRVLLSFTKLKTASHDTYSIQATGLALSGQIGLEGDYHSDTGRFFLAELGAAAAAGLVDSTVSRHQTALGTYVQEPSLANSGKQAATAALSKSAERIAERVRQAPEWTEISAFQEILVIVNDDPKEIGG